MSEHQHADEPATIIYPGAATGRPTVELRVRDDGTNEAFLIAAGAPIPTGISLIQKSDGSWQIHCRIRERNYKFTPEELVRQHVINYLIDDLGYPKARISVEVPIQMGSTVHPKPADIVVFADDLRQQHWLTVEVKKPNRKDGVEQLKSYMNPTGSTFGYWTNGADRIFLLRTPPNDYTKSIYRLPRFGESLADIDEPLTRTRLQHVQDLYAVFKDLEQEILAHQTVDTFNEIFKIVFAKLYDERVNLYNDTAVAQFRLGLSEEPAQAVARVRGLFEKAKGKWRDVYSRGDDIELSDKNIAHCIRNLQQYHLMGSGDVLGTAFELLVNQEMKGEMGQFFTPRQVVDMMTSMLNPRLEETVCDPACGSGGFLIYPMRSVFNFIDSRWDSADDRAEQRKDYAQTHLIGMDNDQRLVRVAKAYMIMENDGRSGVRAADSLDYGSWDKDLRSSVLGRTADLATGTRLTKKREPADGVDVVLTNPPFAGAIKSPSTLRQYDLATKPNGKSKDSVVRAILFIERCLDILKPGGRMGIVLPQGILNNINDQQIRDYIDKQARVLGVVGLHADTFKPFTLAKTSVLFLQKWPDPAQRPKDYKIFTAVSVRPGKTRLGRPQYLADGVTLDCDMDQVAEAFHEFARNEGLEFVH